IFRPDARRWPMVTIRPMDNLDETKERLRRNDGWRGDARWAGLVLDEPDLASLMPEDGITTENLGQYLLDLARSFARLAATGHGADRGVLEVFLDDGDGGPVWAGTVELIEEDAKFIFPCGTQGVVIGYRSEEKFL